MASHVDNEAGFDALLDRMADGFGRDARFKANQAGAEQFKKIMSPHVPYRYNLRKGEAVHLRDSLIMVENPNGSVMVGFTKKGNKGYIGRILNDGWTPKPPGTRKLTSTYEHVEGKHFWENAQREAKDQVARRVYGVLKQEMDKKVKG